MNNVLDSIKNRKWWVQEAAAWLQLCYPWMRGFVRTNEYYEPGYGKCMTFWKDGYAWSIMDEDQDIRVASAIHKRYAADPQTLESKMEIWRSLKDRFEAVFVKINGADLSALTKPELATLYQEFYQAYEDVFTPSLLCEAFVPYAEKYVIPGISKLSQTAGLGKGEKVAAVLTAPLEVSYLTQERMELLSLALKSLDGQDIASDLVDHQKAYFWIKNNYKDDEPISVEEFRSYVQEEVAKGRPAIEEEKLRLEDNIPSLAKEKRALLARLKPDPELVSGMKLIEILGDWQDKRKAVMQKASHYMTLLLRAVSDRSGWSFESVAYATPEEIVGLLSGQASVAHRELEERRKFSAVIMNGEAEEILTGKDAQEVWDMVFTQGKAHEKCVNGVVACIGRVRGKVRIVRDPAKEAFEEGEILVTSMTRPEFVPYMKKALAIVTDEGGLTCHAAIVSRELNVPCIVGTKFATRILRDGDLVEVNADHGSVTKL